MHPFDAAGLTTAAQQKEGLRDWGPLPFETPLQVLADDYAAADLNDIGGHILRSGLVHSLRMRIADELRGAGTPVTVIDRADQLSSAGIATATRWCPRAPMTQRTSRSR